MWFESFGKRFLNAFPAFKERNYRLHFCGQFPSSVGTWMQATTQGWLIVNITHSHVGFWVGVVAAMTTVPTSLFGILGGAIGDRFDLRKVMYVTQWLSVVQAFILGLLVLTGHINQWEVLGLAFFGGCVNAVDTPSRQAIIRQVVGRENLKSGVSINTAMVHSSLLIGPAVGGILILHMNIGWTFILNGMSFVAVLGTLYRMHLSPVKKEKQPILKMAGEGIRYSFSDSRVCILIFSALAAGMFGYPARTIFPLIAKNILHSEVSFTYLVVVLGSGAVLGAIITAIAPIKWSPRYLMITGSWAMGIGFLLFCVLLTRNFNVSLCPLFFAGVGFTLGSATIRALVQLVAEQSMQSRAVAVMITMFSFGVSAGSFLTGFLADSIGPVRAVEVNGVVLILMGIALFPLGKRIAEFSPANATISV